jgi:flagellar motility protein MotE (MotC chaperone)
MSNELEMKEKQNDQTLKEIDNSNRNIKRIQNSGRYLINRKKGFPA